MVRSLILAIDQGGQSSRVAIYTTNGEQVHCFSEPCLTRHKTASGIDFIEQDPEEILTGILRGLDKVADALGNSVKDICAAGFAGQGSSLLCWDKKTGEALSPVLSWQDIRGEHYLKSIPLTQSQTKNITGLRVSPHYGASKIKWCLDNYLDSNANFMAAHKNNSLTIGPIVSYILSKLCGVNAVDPGHAQRTLLWNLQKNNWDEFLLNLFKIPRS